MNTLHEPTPGEILKSEFLDAYGITQYRLAVDAKMPPTRVSEIIRGKRSISLDTARRLSRYFGTTVSFWINLQVQYDLLTTDPKVKREIARISPVTSSLEQRETVLLESRKLIHRLQFSFSGQLRALVQLQSNKRMRGTKGLGGMTGERKGMGSRLRGNDKGARE